MSSMVSLMGGTGIIVAGVGGGVPAVRSAPPSVAAGAGVPFFADVSPGSGGGGAGRSVWFVVVCRSFLARAAAIVEAGRG